MTTESENIWLLISQISTSVTVIFGIASILVTAKFARWSKRVETTNYFHQRFDDFINKTSHDLIQKDINKYWRQYWQLQEEQFIFYSQNLIINKIYKGWMEYRKKEWENNHAFGVDGFRDAYYKNQKEFLPAFRNYIENTFPQIQNKINEFNPIGICWKINSICNYSCEFCFAKNENTNTNLNDQIQILLILKSNNINFLSFTGGEPLLCNDLPILIQIAKKMGFFIDLCTNGAKYTVHFHEQIKEYVDQISIPLDGINNKTINKIRGIPNGKNIFENFAEIVKDSKLTVRVNTLVCNYNKTELHEIMNIVEHYGFQWKLLRYYYINNKISKFYITENEFQKATINITSNKIGITLKPNSNDYQSSFISLDSNGYLYTTINHSHKLLGNIKDNKINKLLELSQCFNIDGHLNKYNKYLPK